MEKEYVPTPEEMGTAEDTMTEEQKAASERREEAREGLGALKDLEIDKQGNVLVGKEKEEDYDRK